MTKPWVSVNGFLLVILPEADRMRWSARPGTLGFRSCQVGVGKGLQKSGKARDTMFITSKDRIDSGRGAGAMDKMATVCSAGISRDN